MMDGVFAPPPRRTDPLSSQQLRDAETALSQSLNQLQSLLNNAFAPGAPAQAANTFDARGAGQAQVPAGLASFAGEHGFDPQEIANLGKLLPVALNAQQALGRGDWQGALNLAAALGPNAGDTMQRLTAGALDAVPAQALQALGA